MNINRIRATLLQEYYMVQRSLETIVDVFVYPIMNIIVFGFISKFLLGSTDRSVFLSLIVAMLFWQIFSTSQYTISVATLWNMWAHNLTNLFATPTTFLEYFIAHAITALIKALLVFFVGALIAYFQFGYNVVNIPFPLLLVIMINLYLSGIAIGLVLVGFIFAYGTRIQALAWGFISIIQPLASVFYPLSVLPEPFQSLARFLPLTYMFEALRQIISQTAPLPIIHTQLMIGSCITLIYLIISFIIFKYLLAYSKDSGQFAKNDL
ncbi:hypothetical protein A2446_04415 [Candidatus Roizmanbacteria bacterium RIFOXYC2_FULL_38_9]|nr:MAG: hypothetical protein A2446_04415 [Candidatus Roizmanbacteria bacterium RIFOXYC2_FULL_38_9]